MSFKAFICWCYKCWCITFSLRRILCLFVLLVSTWSFQPIMAVLGPYFTLSACLRYVLGLIFLTAPSMPLKTTVGKRVLCKTSRDSRLQKEVNPLWHWKAVKKVSPCNLSFLINWRQQAKELVFLAAQKWKVMYLRLFLLYSNIATRKNTYKHTYIHTHKMRQNLLDFLFWLIY